MAQTQGDSVPFRRKPVWFQVTFVVLWVTAITSMIIFLLAFSAGNLTLAIKMAWVVVAVVIPLLILLKFKG